MKGEYASKVGKGALSPIIPTTQSPFTKMMSCPNDVIIYHLQEVFDGKMSIPGLNNAADNYKAFAVVKGNDSICCKCAAEPSLLPRSVGGNLTLSCIKQVALHFLIAVRILQKKQKNVNAACLSNLKEAVIAHINRKAGNIQWSLIPLNCSCRRMHRRPKPFPRTPCFSGWGRTKNNLNVPCTKAIT